MRSCSSGEIFFLQQASLQCQRERPGESESDQHRDDRREQEELSEAGASFTEVTSERASEEKFGTEGEQDTILLSQTSQEVEEVKKSRSEVPLGDTQIINQSGPVSLGQNPTRAKEKSPNKEFKKSGLDGTYWLKEILKSRRNPQKFKRIEAWFEDSNSDTDTEISEKVGSNQKVSSSSSQRITRSSSQRKKKSDEAKEMV